eukprot:9690819-Ditylum_brightwellii.AAC.1
MTNLGVGFSCAILVVQGATDIANDINFYQNGLGLTVICHTDKWAKLTTFINNNTSSDNSI